MIPTQTPPVELCDCLHLVSQHIELPRSHPHYRPQVLVCTRHGCACTRDHSKGAQQ